MWSTRNKKKKKQQTDRTNVLTKSQDKKTASLSVILLVISMLTFTNSLFLNCFTLCGHTSGLCFSSDKNSLSRAVFVSLIWRQTSESEKLTLVDRQMVRSLRIFREKWALCSSSFLSHGYGLLPNKWNPGSEWCGKIQWIFMKLLLSWRCL